jgi:glycosyltransferase involved in cell wall biosynthesis
MIGRRADVRISIVIPILNSHEAVARQVKYFARMNLPDDIEFIFVDDGSNPPLDIKDYRLKNLIIFATHDKRPWTQGLARNKGAQLASGKYLFMTDIDHILSREAIDAVYTFDGFKMVFPRYIAILSEKGTLRQNLKVLTEYGFDLARYKRGKHPPLYASFHGNTFAMKRDTFFELGGYNPRRCQYGFHAPPKKGEDCYFNTAWKHYAAEKGLETAVGPPIYMFPVGRFNKDGDMNPMGLFHKLSYEPVPQPMVE